MSTLYLYHLLPTFLLRRVQRKYSALENDMLDLHTCCDDPDAYDYVADRAAYTEFLMRKRTRKDIS